MKIISRNHLLLKITGLLYENTFGWWYRGIGVLCFVLTFFNFIPQITFAIVHKDNVVKATAGLSIMVSVFLTLLKVLIYSRNMKKIYVLKCLMQLNVDKRMELGYRNNFNAAEKELTLVANVFITSLMCCFIFYTFVPLIFIRDNDNWEIPFDTKFFYKTNTHFSYDITYILCSLSTLAMAVLMCTMDTIFVGLIVYARAHFKDVQVMIKNLDNIYNDGCNGKVKENKQFFFEIFRQHANECVIYHNEVLRFVAIIQDTMGLTIFLQYVCGTMLLCVIIFQITLTVGNDNLPIYISFLSGCVTQLLMYSWYGTSLTHEGLQVADAAYNCCWYKYPIKIQKILLFIQRRAQRPVILTALKIFDCSLDTFMSIYKTSTSALALLQSMTE